MDLSLPSGELIWLAAMLLAGGFITGLLAGMFGIGGGGILVPVLYELFSIIGVDEGLRMHLCVGTALAVIIPTSLRSFHSHYQRGAVDMEVMRRLGPWVAAGVVAGALIAGHSGGAVLKIVYVVAMSLMAAKIFLGGNRWVISAKLPGIFVNALVGAGTGVISTLMGIGGGAYVAAYMTLYGRSIHQAVATSSGFGPIIAIPGAIGYMMAGWGEAGLPPGSLGFVSLLGMLIVAPASVLAAPLGVRIAHGISRRKLEIAFATFLLAVGIRFTVSLINGG